MTLVFAYLSVFGLVDVAQAQPELPQHGHSSVSSPAPSPDVGADSDALSLEITYTADIWRAASGGLRRGTRYLDNLDVIVAADLGKLAGWHGATAFAYGLYNNGRSLNALMGDAQVASNIETGVRAVRLYEAWIEQKLGETGSLRLGLYDLNSEFDTLDASSLFMGSAHGIGTDISQAGQNGPSIFPVTSLAARLALRLDDRWTVRVAVLDGIPGDPARPSATTIKLGRGDGALMIGEVELKLAQGKLLAGYWTYTGSFDRLEGGRSGGNNGIYLRGETALTREGDTSSNGLDTFFRLGIAKGSINAFDRFASAGLVYNGPLRGRDEDQLGLAFAAALTSPAYRRTTGASGSEVVVELTYRAPIASFLTIQPNVQYVFRPNADRLIPNALAIGFRTEVGFKF